MGYFIALSNFDLHKKKILSEVIFSKIALTERSMSREKVLRKIESLSALLIYLFLSVFKVSLQAFLNRRKLYFFKISAQMVKIAYAVRLNLIRAGALSRGALGKALCWALRP